MRRLVLIMVLLLAAVSVTGASAQATDPRVLVFTKTTGHRHDSIPAAIQAVRDLGVRNGFTVTATEDDTTFSAAGLAPFDAVIFLLTSGEILDSGQQAAFEAYIRGGKGYVGVHSAADTERGWPWYGRLVGAWSSGHPEIQPAMLDVATPRDGSTTALPARWSRTDEWYSWLSNPRANGVRVLITLDETTYMPREFAMGADHPIAWQHEFEGGRAWYTQGGHTEESYSEPLFLGHLLGGIQWALAKPTTATHAGDQTAAKPKVVKPRISALEPVGGKRAKQPFEVSVKGHQVSVRVRYEDCKPCRGSLRVRSKTTKLRLSGIPNCKPGALCPTQMGTATGTSAVLPPGRWQVTVTFTNPTSGLAASASRSVRITG